MYPGLKTNNMLGTYEFSEFPMTADRLESDQVRIYRALLFTTTSGNMRKPSASHRIFDSTVRLKLLS